MNRKNITIASYFDLLGKALRAMPLQTVDEICEVLLRTYQNRRTVYIFGNGGSASLASHMACDLAKGTSAVLGDGDRFRAMALTDNLPVLTAWANDSHYENIFVEQLKTWIEAHDVAFAISGSGNSPNVLNALEYAGSVGAFRIGITGFNGGRLKNLCELCLIVPSDNMQIIEDLHVSIAHALFTGLSARLSNKNVGYIAAAAR